MDTLALLVGVLLCLTVVSGRSFEERRDADPLSETEDEGLKKHGSEMRHRRRRWQMNYGYDYPSPVPSYYPERREYDRNQQDLLPKIVRLLEEISLYVRRPQPPPPPPQPIYIPYPVPYPVPQYAPCVPTVSKKPNVTVHTRFPEMEDTNQNWGFALSEEDSNQEVGDGSRPISFDPIKPIRPMQRPAPKVEHGSMQSDSSQTTRAPKFDDEVAVGRLPVMCNAAILSCCAEEAQQQRQCFNNFGCAASYDNGKICSTDSINAALKAFELAYSPMP